MSDQPELSSSMSYAELLAAFQDSAGYDLEATPDVESAKTHIKAGRMLLTVALRRSAQAGRGEEIEVEPEIVERSVTRATAWLAAYRRSQALPTQYVPDQDWRDS